MAEKFKNLFEFVPARCATSGDIVARISQGKLRLDVVGTGTAQKVSTWGRVYRPRRGFPVWAGRYVAVWFAASTEQIHRRYSRGAGSGGGHLSFADLADIEVPTPSEDMMRKVIKLAELVSSLEQAHLKQHVLMREMIRAVAHHHDEGVATTSADAHKTNVPVEGGGET